MGSCSFEGLDFDASTCSNWSVQERTELVYALSELSHEASQMLQAWSRQDILEILCAEMGKERKYTGLTKFKLIENLMKIVNEKKSQQSSDLKLQSASDIKLRSFKGPGKSDNPNDDEECDLGNTVFCKNSACKATLNQGDAFCKRCSCCICRMYDDNKDPSLWLVCSSDPPFQGKSCGMSCHLECAIKHETSCIGEKKNHDILDGAFRCVSCGKVNDLLGSCRKQLIIARDTRRVDIMCYRLSLSQKILSNTKCYLKILEIVEQCISKLETDVGPLTGLPVKKARGIVNRLSSGPEIQKLCISALESLDLMESTRSVTKSSTSLQGCSTMISESVRIEDVCSSSVTVVLCPQVSTGQNVIGYMLWHRKAQDLGYPQEPTCTLFAPTTRFSLSNLTSETDYFLKIVTLDTDRELETREVQIRTGSSGDKVKNQSSKEVDRSQSPGTYCSSLSNPSSVEDETTNILPCNNGIDNKRDNYLAYFENNCKIASADFTACTSESQRGTPGAEVLLLEESSDTGKLESTPETKTTNLESKYSPNIGVVEEMSTDNRSTSPVETGLECVPYVGNSEAHLPITPPCKLENIKDIIQKRNGRPKPHSSSKPDLDCGSGREEEHQPGSSSKKRTIEQRDVECTEIGDKDFEYYVKVIRFLECEGHVEKSFREKFLTWYSLRAKPQEVRIVKVFIDTMIEDPESLAGQLVDTFSDVISNKQSCTVSAGFCHKLWH